MNLIPRLLLRVALGLGFACGLAAIWLGLQYLT